MVCSGQLSEVAAGETEKVGEPVTCAGCHEFDNRIHGCERQRCRASTPVRKTVPHRPRGGAPRSAQLTRARFPAAPARYVPTAGAPNI